MRTSRCFVLLLASLSALASRAEATQAIALVQRVAVPDASLSLELRGDDDRAPILLWLHGGPGGAETPLFQLFDAELESHFVVAYLDQRGAGRSFDPDADPAELTVARHLTDLDAVVDQLLAQLGRHQLTLVGHSWGSALGLLYAKAHPEKVAALIGVGQFTSMRAQQTSELEFVSAEARRRSDGDALSALTEIGQPPFDRRRQLALEKLTDRFGGVFHSRPSFAWAMTRGIFGGYVTPWEIPRFIRGNDVSLDAMNAELSQLDLPESVTEVAVPVFFFLGRYDRHVDSRLAARYFDELRAPRKRLVWFERSAHNVPFEEPETFAAAVVDAARESGVEPR